MKPTPQKDHEAPFGKVLARPVHPCCLLPVRVPEKDMGELGAGEKGFCLLKGMPPFEVCIHALLVALSGRHVEIARHATDCTVCFTQKIEQGGGLSCTVMLLRKVFTNTSRANA